MLIGVEQLVTPLRFPPRVREFVMSPNTKLLTEPIDDSAKMIIQPSQTSLRYVGWNPAIIGISDPTSDAGKRIRVTSQ
jgi:hypothetical protein